MVLSYSWIVFILSCEIEFAASAHAVHAMYFFGGEITGFLGIDVADVGVTGFYFLETVCFGHEDVVVVVH